MPENQTTKTACGVRIWCMSAAITFTAMLILTAMMTQPVSGTFGLIALTMLVLNGLNLGRAILGIVTHLKD